MADQLLTPSEVKVKLHESFPVIIQCMSPGSTGYHWVWDPASSPKPNPVNITNQVFVEYVPGMPGSDGIQIFMFRAKLTTGSTYIMDFKLTSPVGEISREIHVKLDVTNI